LFRPDLRVLLVEDDPLIQEVLMEYLDGEGYKVETASNGLDGLEKFAPGRFDVVLSDKAMPEMSGDQMALEIRKQCSKQPIILMTGYGDLMNAAGECPEGIDAVVGKPVSIAHLLETIAKVLLSKEMPS
jgi:CheY-like chemotaxis protein